FSHLMDLAQNGDLSKVDLTIGDITEEGSLANMGADITASNLGKITDTATPADLAMGIVNLVYQSIGMFAVFAARAREIRDIVLTGNLSTIDFIGPRVFDRLEELYPIRFIKPERAEFATAIGAALSARADG
ncbi:MAG: pantothenate kinase, partial [Clostridia bacterium]|nr:pantothenate kinase [Clostridia bacterium]